MASTDFINTALIIVDIQPIYVNQICSQEFIHNIEKTLCFMRKQLPPQKIVHVRAEYSATPMRPHCILTNPNFPTPGHADTSSTEWARELEGETVILKSTFDAFHQTTLEESLKTEKVDNVLICGMLTSICVHSTALGAVHRGFITKLIEDACLDRTIERHVGVMSLYKNYIYKTCTVDELIV